MIPCAELGGRSPAGLRSSIPTSRIAECKNPTPYETFLAFAVDLRTEALNVKSGGALQR